MNLITITDEFTLDQLDLAFAHFLNEYDLLPRSPLVAIKLFLTDSKPYNWLAKFIATHKEKTPTIQIIVSPEQLTTLQIMLEFHQNDDFDDSCPPYNIEARDSLYKKLAVDKDFIDLINQ